MFEKPLTISEMVEWSGLPEGLFRNAVKRHSNKHPLPCVKSGNSKPTIYIRKSVFEKWYEEEELL